MAGELAVWAIETTVPEAPVERLPQAMEALILAVEAATRPMAYSR
jgi:hypothetical protein